MPEPRDENPFADYEIMTCWCGVQGKPADLFDYDGLPTSCGGIGSVECICGGDFCVCHFHGEVECPGCLDCRSPDQEHDDWEPEDIVPLDEIYDRAPYHHADEEDGP